jgi:hypothetical protein
MTKTSAQNPPPEKRDDHYEPHTAQNALIFALETLSSVSRNIPGFGSVLSSVIDPLLAITARVEVRLVAFIIVLGTHRPQESSDNARGFIQLAARIRRIAGILEDTPNQGLIADLQRSVLSRPQTSRRPLTARAQRIEFHHGGFGGGPIARGAEPVLQQRRQLVISCKTQ